MASLFDGPVQLPEGYPVSAAPAGQSSGLPEGFLPKLFDADIDPKPTDPSLQ
ncbi:MAG: hypothetical protein WAS36_01285 [Candidatus Saccharimonadales bacterium]